MIRINFYLKADRTNPRKLIRVHVSFNAQRWAENTGIKIDPNHWDKKKQKIKSTAGEIGQLQQITLNNIATSVEKKYWKVINKKQRLMTKPEFKAVVQKAAGLQKQKHKEKKLDFIAFAEDLLRKKTESKKIGPHTSVVRQSHLNIIRAYYKLKQFSYKDITPNWFMAFQVYLQEEKDYSHNSIEKIISEVKSYMNSSLKAGIHKNSYYKEYKITRGKVVNVYCTVADLKKLYNHKPSTPSLERSRDEFLLSAFTGLRFSDGIELSTDRIVRRKEGNVFEMNIKKTKTKLEIPVLPIVEQILNKYGGKMSYVTNTAQNKNLKLLFKEAGFNRSVYKPHTKGGKRTEHKYQFWQLVTTHTARRSLATNLHLAKHSLVDIMAITGHKSIKQLQQYICTTGNESRAAIMKSSFYENFKLRPA